MPGCHQVVVTPGAYKLLSDICRKKSDIFRTFRQNQNQMPNRKEKHKTRALADPATQAISTLEGAHVAFNTFGTGEGKDALHLIQLVREGLNYPLFEQFSSEAPFSSAEWAGYLHLSERTIQRYKKEQSSFEPAQTERILEIILLFNQGEKVFGQKEKFSTWLNAKSVALGNIKPKELLDSSFGINLLRDELIKIEHGVLA